MPTTIRFFGVSAYEVIDPQGRHILFDPFLDQNPGSPIKSTDLERVDLIVVSHAAIDHFGDTEAIAKRTGAPVVCGADVRAYLAASGLPATQLMATVWGIKIEVAGVVIQPVECRHWSSIKLPDGQLVSGVPVAYVAHIAPNVRFYHYGDTAIFSDLQLIGRLYKPTIGAIGITVPVEIVPRFPMAGRILTGEMSPPEGVLAAQWLGLDYVMPCHYCCTPDCDDVREFLALTDAARARGEKVAQPLVLKPGDSLVLDDAGKVVEHRSS